MIRSLVGVCAVLLVACGGSSAPGSPAAQGPPSAQKVAASDSDFSGMQKCPESGSWDSYLKAEQTVDPTQYQTDKASWDDFKAAGADDSYIAVYAANTADCGKFASGTPSGKVADVFAIRFKDSASASSNFKTNSKDFHLSDSDVANLKAAGGTIQQGAATGLGDNAISVSIALGGASVYVAFWQKKQFEVALFSFNLPTADGAAVTKKINERIG
jgi:hypothetical protein